MVQYSVTVWCGAVHFGAVHITRVFRSAQMFQEQVLRIKNVPDTITSGVMKEDLRHILRAMNRMMRRIPSF